MNAPANDQSKALADNLRVMFAAAAPAEIPDWFNPPEWIAGTPDPGPAPEPWGKKQMEAWKQNNRDFFHTYQRERYFAWRVYYANEMTARVVKEMGK